MRAPIRKSYAHLHLDAATCKTCRSIVRRRAYYHEVHDILAAALAEKICGCGLADCEKVVQFVLEMRAAGQAGRPSSAPASAEIGDTR